MAWETALQDNVPQQALGRVASWDYLASFLAMPIGNAAAGPLASAYGVDRVLTVCSAVLFVAGLSQFLIPGVRHLTRAAPAAEPVGVLVKT